VFLSHLSGARLVGRHFGASRKLRLKHQPKHFLTYLCKLDNAINEIAGLAIP
jgi:hypothetical protein